MDIVVKRLEGRLSFLWYDHDGLAASEVEIVHNVDCVAGQDAAGCGLNFFLSGRSSLHICTQIETIKSIPIDTSLTYKEERITLIF